MDRHCNNYECKFNVCGGFCQLHDREKQDDCQKNDFRYAKISTTQKLYNLCNKHGYYTCGSNADYDNLFKLTDLSAIAYDIFTHSSDVFDYETILQTVKAALES